MRSYRAKLSATQSPLFAKLIGDADSVVTIKASVGEGEAKGPPTFDGVAYSGGIVSRTTLSKPIDADYIIDLAGFTPGKNVKANLDHKASQRVGHLTSNATDGKQIIVQGLLSAETPDRDVVAKSSGNGYTWETSIEAALSQPRKLAAGKKETINGREVTGPLWVFGKSVLSGLAFVNNGADAGNNVTVAATAAGGAQNMNEFEKFVAEMGLDPATLNEVQRAKLTKAFEAQSHQSTATLDDDDDGGMTFARTAALARQDRDRRISIAKLGQDAIGECPMLIDQIEKLVTDAQETKMSVKDFELQLLRNLRTKAGRINAQLSGTISDPLVIEAAICMATGMPEEELSKHFTERTIDAADRSGMSKGFSIQSMLMQAAHANGYTCRAGERVHRGNLREVLTYALPPQALRAHLGQFSTVSLPNILGNVANKNIRMGYKEEDPSWREFAEIKPVSNFYQQTHYRMLDNLEYEEIGSGGEIPHGTLGEESFTSQAKTYGKMLGLTRVQLINDDLGAFNDIRQRLGRGAAKKFLTVFWTAFINNSTFFTSALTNYISGSTTNLGIDGVGLGLMVAAFRQMTSPTADGSKRVGQDLNPTKVLVPPELEANAGINYKNQNLGAVANSSANIYQGKYRPVVQWRLSNSSFTGYSTTAWYMFGDDVKPMVVTRLGGQEGPVVESTEADFDTLGILFRGYDDFGCDKSEYLAGVKSKGAA